MRCAAIVLNAALTVQCLAIAACGGKTPGASPGTAQSPGANAASPSGTSIPTASRIVDSAGNVWTLVSGVANENGSAAGHNANGVLVLYYKNRIYVQNDSNSWWSWNGSGWQGSDGDPRVSAGDPTIPASASGTAIPSATQIVDAHGNVWTVSGGAVYVNGVHAGSSVNTALLLYHDGVVYTQNDQGALWSWDGNAWVASGYPPPSPSADGLPATASPAGTTIPSATQIVDDRGNTWTVSGGAVYLNGVHAGSSGNVALLVYDNGVVYTQNNQGGWWSWNGSGWLVSGHPRSTDHGAAAGASSP